MNPRVYINSYTKNKNSSNHKYHKIKENYHSQNPRLQNPPLGSEHTTLHLKIKCTRDIGTVIRTLTSKHTDDTSIKRKAP